MACQHICNAWHEGWPLWWLASNGVPLGELVVLVLVEGVDVCSSELASRHLFGEEDVEFVEGAVFGFGEAEVGPDEDEPCACSPERLLVTASGVGEVEAYQMKPVYPLRSQASGFMK